MFSVNLLKVFLSDIETENIMITQISIYIFSEVWILEATGNKISETKTIPSAEESSGNCRRNVREEEAAICT